VGPGHDHERLPGWSGGITCPCYWVDPIEAFFIGIIGAVAIVYSTDLLEYLRIDDPIGAVPVHMAAGMAGTMSLGLFAAGVYGAPTATGVNTSSVVTGLFYGGGVAQLWIQAYGTITVAVAVFVVSMALMYAVKLTGALRVSHAGELEGLDRHEHGVPAYPEFVTAFSGLATPPTNGSVSPPAVPSAGGPVSAG
jgi:ammonium transporter, Amt family